MPENITTKNDLIRIKRTYTKPDNEVVLRPGELFYSFLSDKLFIGEAGAPNRIIGGASLLSDIVNLQSSKENVGVASSLMSAHISALNPHNQYELKSALGTAAYQPISAFVSSTDTRLTDARQPLSHTHSIGNVIGLQAALDGKESTGTASSLLTAHINNADPHPTYLLESVASSTYALQNHTHTVLSVEGLGSAAEADIEDFAGAVHSHAIADITGLQSTLNAKADDTDLANYYTKVESNTLLSGKSDVGHNHSITDVTGLSTALEGKVDEVDLAAYYTRNETDTLLAGKEPTITVLPISKGGTGSGTQNFVDLTTNQSISGLKKFTSSLTVNKAGAVVSLLDLAVADANSATGQQHMRFEAGTTAVSLTAFGAGTNNGDAYLDFNLLPASNTNGGFIRFFRTTNTTGAVGVVINRGNGGSGENHRLSGNGASFLQGVVGNLGIGTITAPNAKLQLTGGLVVTSLAAAQTDPGAGNVSISGNTHTQGFRVAYVSKNAAYTLTTLDMVVLGDTSTASFTLTLPSASSVGGGKIYRIKRSGGNNLTIATSNSELIDGAATFLINTNNGAIDLVSTGSAWLIL